MNKRIIKLRAVALLIAVSLSPLGLFAQTRVEAPKNKYQVQDDVKLGRQAASEVERQFPIINDRDSADYLERVGGRLVDQIPANLRQPQFDYRFRWVNASDLNAFALPGGPMYVNRGMIENARNEGELAGVMAHEISHIALRHATAQATKQSSGGSILRNLGLILGGAILGGQAGAQLGAIFAQGWALKYSREYESQADLLGAQIMAAAGYDPRDLANVFQTIAREGSRSGPEWLSSHPDPGNRFQRINQIANSLRVSPEPIKVTQGFLRTQDLFRSMPPARSMAEIQRGSPSGNSGGYGNEGGYSTGRYSSRVEYPSSRMRTADLDWARVNIPSNWRELSGGRAGQYAPDGAYGDQGITHGVLISAYGSSSFENDSENYLRQVLQSNSYLQQRTGFSRTYVGGRYGYMTILAGRSPVTGRTEIVTIYTTQLRNGETTQITTVVPEVEASAYNYAFREIVNSIRAR